MISAPSNGPTKLPVAIATCSFAITRPFTRRGIPWVTSDIAGATYPASPPCSTRIASSHSGDGANGISAVVSAIARLARIAIGFLPRWSPSAPHMGPNTAAVNGAAP